MLGDEYHLHLHLLRLKNRSQNRNRAVEFSNQIDIPITRTTFQYLRNEWSYSVPSKPSIRPIMPTPNAKLSANAN
jgi:hypothetical protein